MPVSFILFTGYLTGFSDQLNPFIVFSAILRFQTEHLTAVMRHYGTVNQLLYNILKRNGHEKNDLHRIGVRIHVNAF
jgi:hypothetical protein